MIKELIDDQTRLLNEDKKHKKKKKSFYCSDAYKCPKKIYFDFRHKEEAEEYEPRILRIFQCGDDVHARICMYLDRAGVLESVETEAPPNIHNITGRVDAVLKDGTIVEIKSINSQSVSKPIKEHVGQLQLYLHLYGKENGILIYECKPNQKICEFEIKKDIKIINEILQEFKDLQPYLLKSTPPERRKSYTKSKYPCKYCNYRSLCYKK